MSEQWTASFRSYVRPARTCVASVLLTLLRSAGAFDDAEVIHVEGDVDPCRDMSIIQTELRLKDAEWVEKHLNGEYNTFDVCIDTNKSLSVLKKSFRGTGTANLADKAKKFEIVRTLVGIKGTPRRLK